MRQVLLSELREESKKKIVDHIKDEDTYKKLLKKLIVQVRNLRKIFKD